MNTRLRELDFLRGIAIILVFLRHQRVEKYTATMGWMGVDLFFVLSGFLVTTLLFSEYVQYGNMQPERFLIRRGFKIYPIYYITYLLYLIDIIRTGKLNVTGLIGDLVFLQNYISGFGYAYSASWSLSVEEHFYFLLCFFLWLTIKYRPSILSATGTRFSRFEIIVLSIMAACIALRFMQNILWPLQNNFSQTHLRMDSLLTGVLISYLYHFKADRFRQFLSKHKVPLTILTIACLAWTPFIEPELSFFTQTIGFTLVYIAFGIIVSYFVLFKQVNQVLNKIFTKTIVGWVSKIGYSSYAIYLIHQWVINHTRQYAVRYNLMEAYIPVFVVAFLFSVFLGMAITYTIEKYFLEIRDKYFPKRKVKSI